MGGRLSTLQAGMRYLFGPTHWKGEHLREKMGSIMMLAWLPIEMTAVECPIQVYVILFYELVNLGVVIGSNLSSYS